MEKIPHKKAWIQCFLLTVFFFAGVSQQIQAQAKNVTGNVKDESGQVLPGTSILVIGTSIGTMTDFDGNYEVRVTEEGKRISFSSMGYVTQEVPYTGQETINIVLKEDRSQLDEVIVVGYGTQKAQDVTGAIAKVKVEEIERTINTTAEQALTGRIAGVNTTTSDGSLGSGMRIRIRGGTSINANNEPLYVIDGMPIEVNYEVEQGPSAIDGPQSSPLANLDPDAIQSIEVLKDASAAAIYGARGANGVVIITTKKGQAGKAKMTFDVRTSLSMVPDSRFVDVLNTSQYGKNLIDRVQYNKGVYNPNALITVNTGGESYVDLTPEEAQVVFDNAANTDWQDEIYQLGVITNYSFGVSGGSEGNLYSIRTSYLNNEGTVKNSYFKRYNANFNFQNKINDKFKVVSVLAPSYSVKRGPTSGGAFNQRNMGSVIKALSRQPDRVVGQIEEDQEEGGIWLDPVTEAEKTQTLQNTYGFNGNLNFIYTFSKGLTANVRLGMNYMDGVNKAFFPGAFGRGQRSNGLGTRFHYRNLNLNAQYMLNYRTAFGQGNKHKLTLLGGYTKTDNKRDTEYIQTTDFEVESAGYDGLHYGLVPLAPETVFIEKTMISYLTRANYGYANKYNFTFSMRADGSSVFINDKWGYFPAAAFGWNAHNESFLKNAKAISNLKLRLSYGQTGNAGIPPYASFGLLNVANYAYGETTVASLSSASITNPDLKWEFTDQYNLGIDLGMFQNRIGLTAEVYYKETTDLLLRMPLPISSGFDSWLTNVGSVENKGLEVSLNTINFDGDFKWSTDINFSINRNKVLDMGGAYEQTFDDQFTNGTTTGLLRVGESLGNWLGYETAGVFTYDDFVDPTVANPVLKPELVGKYGAGTGLDPIYGDLKYVDQPTVPVYETDSESGEEVLVGYTGDGIINGADSKIIARTQPKHFGSIYNSFSYKGIELGLFFTYKYGFDVVNGNRHRLNGTGGDNWNKTSEVLNAWTPANPTGTYPRPDYLADKRLTDLSIEDGSFVRFQSMNIAYNVPSKHIRDIGLTSLKIYSNVDNIYIWTKYSGYDPEVGVANGQRAITSAGLDYGAYPRTLNVALGVKVGF